MNAANCYEQLTVYYPDVEDYRIYYAQALYQACLYEEAMKVTVQIDSPASQGKVCTVCWSEVTKLVKARSTSTGICCTYLSICRYWYVACHVRLIRSFTRALVCSHLPGTYPTSIPLMCAAARASP